VQRERQPRRGKGEDQIKPTWMLPFHLGPGSLWQRTKACFRQDADQKDDRHSWTGEPAEQLRVFRVLGFLVFRFLQFVDLGLALCQSFRVRGVKIAPLPRLGHVAQELLVDTKLSRDEYLIAEFVLLREGNHATPPNADSIDADSRLRR